MRVGPVRLVTRSSSQSGRRRLAPAIYLGQREADTTEGLVLPSCMGIVASIVTYGLQD